MRPGSRGGLRLVRAWPGAARRCCNCRAPALPGLTRSCAGRMSYRYQLADADIAIPHRIAMILECDVAVRVACEPGHARKAAARDQPSPRIAREVHVRGQVAVQPEPMPAAAHHD